MNSRTISKNIVFIIFIIFAVSFLVFATLSYERAEAGSLKQTNETAGERDPETSKKQIHTTTAEPEVTTLDIPGFGTGPIPDSTSTSCQNPGAPRDVMFNVTGATGNLQSVKVSTRFDPAHSWAGDLIATLIAPGGSRSLDLFGYTGSTTANISGDNSNLAGPYTFTDSATGANWWTAATSVGETVNVPIGDYRTTRRGGVGVTNPAPITSLNTTFGALTPAQTNGLWTLRFTDGCAADTGTVAAATLSLAFNCISAPPGLVSWWAGDGNSFDYQGGNQGTLNGDTSYAPGKVREAFNFDGDGDYVSITEDGSLDLQDGNFSVDAWVYLRSSKLHYILGKNDCLTNSYALSVNELNRVVFNVISSAGDEPLESAEPITLNGWHHVAGVKNGSTLQLYIDGVLSVSRPLNGTLSSNDALFTIGDQATDLFCNLTQPSGTDGLIDEVDVFNRALTAAEIQSVYNSGGDGKCQPALLLSFNPNPVMAGNISTGTFTLSIPAPAGGANVTLLSSDSSVAAVPASITIAEGETSGTFTVTTPPRESDTFVNIEGTYNGLSKSTTLSVLRSRPDLQITSATAPSEVSTAFPFDITWTDFNAGIADVPGSWTDEVFFSTNNLLDGADRSLGRFVFTGPLASGQGGSVTHSVAIPPSAIAADGDYFLILRTDTFNIINEGGFENNNLIVRPIYATRRAPDLQVSNPVVPAETNTAVSFSVSWTDTNAGDAPAGPSWNDQVYFSIDNQVGGDTLLGNLGVTGPLAPSGTIARSVANLTIPSSSIPSTGDYFIYIRTDSSNVIDEGPTANENNNIVFRPIHVNLVAPDLQVSSVTTLPEVETNQEFEISWTLTNSGTARANPTWTDCVFFSSDNQIGSDTSLGCFSFSQGLDPNQTLERIQNVSIPLSLIAQTGDYYIFVQTDVNNTVDEGPGGNNNNRSAFRPLRVRRTLRPDLRVASVVAPDTAFFDQDIQVQWTVTNDGPGSTNSYQWTDRFFLSTDTVISGDDTDLGGRQNISYLNAGESYIAVADIKLPRGVFGNLNIIVKTDYSGSVGEDVETNNTRSKAINVQVPPLPDLQVTLVQAPEEGFAGQPVLVNWRVENRGTGNMPPQSGSWSDRIYLSEDTTLNPAIDRLVATRQRSGPLAQNEGYNVNGYSINLPVNIIGSWYVFVLTDAGNQIYEFSGENNNSHYDNQQPGSPVLIRATPPDLIIPQQLSAPSSAEAGIQIPISFLVQNQGAFEAAPIWYDKVYLSPDNIFSPASDTSLGTILRAGPLGAGLDYTVNTTVTLPTCISGNYYLFGIADSGNQIFEFDPKIDAETNNSSSPKQLQINNAPPDLRVTAVNSPAGGEAGEPIQIDWTVVNSGVGPTQTGTWYDRIFLSSSAGQGGTTISLGTFLHSPPALAPGEAYSRSTSVTIPANLQGEWFVHVTTDQTNSVFECGGESNNTLSNPISLPIDNPTLNQQPDLRVDNIVLPQNIRPGETITVQWTGDNNGNLDLPFSSWNDSVYLSNNSSLSSDDTLLRKVLVSRALTVGATYPAQTTVSVPGLQPGTYFFIVVADSDAHIHEGNFENNNSSVRSFNLPAPEIDLQVSGVTAPGSAFAGQSIDILFTVVNSAAEPSFATNWTDYAVLSRDLVLDSTDRTVGYFHHSGSLAGGASYTSSGNISLPAALSGEYNLLVVTDRYNNVPESNETNNIGTPAAINVELAPPADLVIDTVTPISFVTPGEQTIFSWIGRNTGSNPASGSWSDSVYLSTNTTWDINDVLIGQRIISGPLNPGAAYNASLAMVVPAINLGTYYVIIRTDSRNFVRESNEINNAGAASTPTVADVTELQLGVPVSSIFSTGQERYYKVFAPANETLLVTLDGEGNSSNELYTRFGQMVSRSQYDVLYSRPYEADQETVIPNTTAGTYYNLARADLVLVDNAVKETGKSEEKPAAPAGSGTETMTIKAETIPFGIRRVSPAITGKDRYTTITIEGSKFTNDTMVRIGAANGTFHLPELVDRSPAKISALFDFANVPVGNYAVEVINPGNQIARHENAIQVVSGGGASVSVQVLGPDTLRPETRGTFNVLLTNNGRNDSVASVLMVQVPQGSTVELQDRSYERIAQRSVLPEGFNSWRDIPLLIDHGGFSYLPVSVPLIKAGSFRTFSLNVTPPAGATNLKIRAIMMPSSLSLETNVNRTEADGASCPANRGDCAKLLAETIWDDAFDEVKEELLDLLPFDCAREVIDFYVADHINESIKADLGFDEEEDGGLLPFLWDLIPPVSLVQSCGADILKRFPVVKVALEVVETVNEVMDAAEDLENIYNKCLRQVDGAAASGGSCAGDESGGGSGSKDIPVRRPSDPNDKVGPAGFGAQKFVALNQTLDYRINFENMATATAYAQKIRIVDQLPTTLDARTFRLKEIGFGSYRYTVPDNRAFYQNRAQLGEDLGNLLVDISAGLDLVTGGATWTLTAIDPETGEQPASPNLGLLPPNGPDNLGQGYVTFTARPKITNPTGTAIPNTATIIFDTEPPIITNSVSNTLDAVAPNSSVSALPGTSGPILNLQWSGADDEGGSGLQGFDVWVSENGSAYTLYRSATTDTSGVFNARHGITYRFYSTTRDNAGNIEAPPESPDAVTTVEGGAYEGDIAPRPNGTNDAAVTDGDVSLTRRFSAGLEGSFLFNEVQRADSAPLSSGGNGSFSIADVIQARRFAMGLDPVVFASGPLTLNLGKLPVMSSSMAAREIRAFRQNRIGNKLLIRIELEAQGDEAGAGFTINFDPNVLSNPSNVQLGADAGNGSLTSNSGDVSQGRLGILIDRSPNQPLAQGRRQILTLEFDIAPNSPQTTEISFGGLPVINEVVDGNANPLATGFVASTISLFAGPTAAGVVIGGRVTKADGTGIGNALINLTDQNGTIRIARTSAFGYYSFENVAAGQTYFLSARHKYYHFATPTIIVTIMDARDDLNFTVQKE
jgi:hypothetical protein